jgi:adenylate cyclase, class 2
VRVVVDKQREIYFLGNVKFHIDTVQRLGNFMEIEARDPDGIISREQLHEQCTHYMCLFGIEQKDLLSESYSDMLLQE